MKKHVWIVACAATIGGALTSTHAGDLFSDPAPAPAPGLAAERIEVTATGPYLGDFDDDGWIGLDDYSALVECMAGPNTLPDPESPRTRLECLTAFDYDGDFDVDLVDFRRFQTRLGHTPIPLRDTLGRVIHGDWTVAYSGRQTCGTAGCHDVDHIANGFKFQQGRTDQDGNIIFRDDYFQDGRWWIKSGGRYGGALPVGTPEVPAGKQNADESHFDLTTFGWVGDCAGCHVGGGPGEFDLDGQRFWDRATGLFGFEQLGKTWDDVALDGDYAQIDSFGNLTQARWDITGLAEPDCLYCHTPDPDWASEPDMRNAWRSAALAAKTELVDNQGQSVPAYEAAGPAGQGWFSSMETNAAGAATVLQLDYSVGVGDGSLVDYPDRTLALKSSAVDSTPRDKACWSCHSGAAVIRGDVWFDERIVHYAKFNNLNDADPANDVSPEHSTTCNYCHPGDLDHNFAKGNNPIIRWRDETDWVGFRSCRECHLWNSLDPHPDAPVVGGESDPVEVHRVDAMMDKLSCAFCHIPYPMASPSWGVLDLSAGIPGFYMTNEFYSADPLNPDDPDKSRWYAGFKAKTDSDGQTRFFPEALFHYVYWGDWDQNGTPEDRSDDVVAPIPMWRIRDVTGGGAHLPVVTDDNGDGKKEINRPEEILAYIQALKGNDHHGRQVAANPVLSKGYRIFYEDPQAPGGVNSFNPDEAGMHVEHGGRLGLSHSVLPASEAWGAGRDCDVCHRDDGLSPVFDRKFLVDPFGPDGNPIYETIREILEVDTAGYHDNVVLKDVLGDPIALDSTAPYNGRQTCGGVGCHDIDAITNGMHFQQGRTDSAGNVVMKDDFFEDGQFWNQSPGRYGIYTQVAQRQHTSKQADNESEFDRAAFDWIRECSACHPGSGPGEFDRDGQLLYNDATGEFGYELLGKTANDVTLDSDYAVMDTATGQPEPARWDVTGVSGPDCLQCHRRERTGFVRNDMNRVWREKTLSAGTELVDNELDPVPAFAAAGTAGQGWFSNLDIDGVGPPILQIDYNVGVDDGSLRTDEASNVVLNAGSLNPKPTDQVCMGCHRDSASVAGFLWFDDRDVHMAYFGHRDDQDPLNDVSDSELRTCLECHPVNPQHNPAKGNSLQLRSRNDADWADFRTCRDCHLTELPNGKPNPLKHPDAPDVPGDELVHLAGTGENGPMEKISCQGCHIPYALAPATLFIDAAGGGSGRSNQFYSADPLDPSDPDKSKWYPALVWKQDSDGVTRLFPANPWPNIFWGEWNRNGTPEDLSDDVVSPIIQWRINQALAAMPPVGITDDNGDTRPEVNRPEEIMSYLVSLRNGIDSYGRPVATNPVLVKGDRIWHEDPDNPGTVISFAYEGTGIPLTWTAYVWDLNHNVLKADQAWGAGVPFIPSCVDCHSFDGTSPVFDRKILIDPYGPDGQPVYKTVGDMVGLHPT